MESSTVEKNNKEQPSQRLAGSCLCGASKYAVLNQPIKMLVCHCINCKKFSSVVLCRNGFVVGMKEEGLSCQIDDMAVTAKAVVFGIIGNLILIK